MLSKLIHNQEAYVHLELLSYMLAGILYMDFSYTVLIRVGIIWVGRLLLLEPIIKRHLGSLSKTIRIVLA